MCSPLPSTSYQIRQSPIITSLMDSPIVWDAGARACASGQPIHCQTSSQASIRELAGGLAGLPRRLQARSRPATPRVRDCDRARPDLATRQRALMTAASPLPQAVAGALLRDLAAAGEVLSDPELLEGY